MKKICIASRVPLHEIDRARNGVPMEQLDKLVEPYADTPPKGVYGDQWKSAITPKSKKKKS
ncbi:MAG: hypothetical protein ACKPA7_18725, partial [Sphaerospermopsis kisseleviana]